MCTITQTNARGTATMVLRDAMFELYPRSQAGIFLFEYGRLGWRSSTRIQLALLDGAKGRAPSSRP